jgi:hypothetical protein
VQYLKKLGPNKVKVWGLCNTFIDSSIKYNFVFVFSVLIIGEGGHLKEHMKPFKHLR